MKKILTPLILTAVAALIACSTSYAQVPAELAGKQIRIIVPQTAAGASDSLARVMAQALSKKWSIPVIVENRPGAGGNIGSEAVARSAPDGTTWLMSYSGTHSINPSLYKNMSFDMTKDLAPIASLATLPFVLVITPSLPIHDFKAFVSYAKAHPGQVNIASSGNGSVAHLLDNMMDSAASIETVHVPYKGVAGSLTDVMSGLVQGTFASAPSVMGQIKSGQVRAIAASATQRSQALPEVPTFAEAGFPALAIDAWFAFFVPATTPESLRQRIHDSINSVLADPEIVAQFESKGAAPMVTSLKVFQQTVEQDGLTWGKAVKDSGAKID